MKPDKQNCLELLQRSLKLPVIVAPMFLVSGPQFVTAACHAGVIGSFPASNARTLDEFDAWMTQIVSSRTSQDAAWAVNLIVHRSNERFEGELDLVRKYKPSLVVSALGSPSRIVAEIHSYGGIVFADVTNPTFALNAVAAGIDGLILVCSGAGGHTGEYSPFAFVREVRRFWTGPVVIAGAISDARGIRAAEMLGADFVYMGTRFIAAKESLISNEYRQMLVESRMEDIVSTRAVTGVQANFLRASLERAGFDLSTDAIRRKVDFSAERLNDAKAWKSIWGAGQGVGSVERVCTISEIVDELLADYSTFRL